MQMNKLWTVTNDASFVVEDAFDQQELNVVALATTRGVDLLDDNANHDCQQQDAPFVSCRDFSLLFATPEYELGI
jgi:hypothetical protein